MTTQASYDNDENQTKTIKVFLLLGDSSMNGWGECFGNNQQGTLENAVLNKHRFPYLLSQQPQQQEQVQDQEQEQEQEQDNPSSDASKTLGQTNIPWATSSNVRFLKTIQPNKTKKNNNKKPNAGLNVQYNDWLSVKGRKYIGPEVEIGCILGHYFPDDEILLVKPGIKDDSSLGWDLLPPTSPKRRKYYYDDDVKDAFLKENNGDNVDTKQQNKNQGLAFYPGHQYDLEMAHIQEVLSNIDKYYYPPNSTRSTSKSSKYEISGIFFWQGKVDCQSQHQPPLKSKRKNPPSSTSFHFADEYEENLKLYIDSIRSDLMSFSKQTSKIPFVCGTVPFQAQKEGIKKNIEKVVQAQMAVDSTGTIKENDENNPKTKKQRNNDCNDECQKPSGLDSNNGMTRTVDLREIWRPTKKAPFRFGMNAEVFMEAGNAMGLAMVQCLSSLFSSSNTDSGSKESNEKSFQWPTQIEIRHPPKRQSNVPKSPVPAINKPVKVFILMGQSNMIGFGKISGNDEGSLEYAVHHKNRFQGLWDDNEQTWKTFPNVRNVQVMEKGKMRVLQNAWLTVRGNTFGPEIGIGWMLAEHTDEPVLLLKSCIGNRSLGWDLLPPGSPRVEVDGMIYAGYKDSPSSWKASTEPVPIKWYAGKQYDDDTGNAKTVLENLEEYFPGATNYEIAGFFFWQGHKDSFNKLHADLYEKNLVRLIESLRRDFDAPKAPFVCATVGFGGRNMKGNMLKIWNAQIAIMDGEKYPNFRDNVKTADTRDSWRKTGKAACHYGLHAETYMEVGIAMGNAMIDIIKKL